jgi:hypothetical protein
VLGSCEVDYIGGNAHHFNLPHGPVAFVYRLAVLGEEGEILEFVDYGEVPKSPRLELMLAVGDFEFPSELPGWKGLVPKRIIEVGSF